LELPTVVSSLVEGVLLANRDLMASYDGRARVDTLEFVELYAQRAEDAARIVRDIDHYLPASLQLGARLRPESRLVRGEGGLPSSPSADYGAGLWRRLIISGVDGDTANARTSLSFTSLGGARADMLPHDVDRASSIAW
jgi:hypothetical protein